MGFALSLTVGNARWETAMAHIDWLIVGKYKPIRFEIDIDARKAKASIPGVLEAEGRPIKSPATGQDHRVRINMPRGIEFDIAEIGSGSATTKGTVAFTLKDSYGQFNRLRHNGGVVIH